MLYRLKRMLEASGQKQKPSYTLTEAARILGISESTVRRMVEDGAVKAFRPRGHWRIDMWELERLVSHEDY